MLSQQNNNLKRRKILWIVPIILDVELYKESVLEILRHLAKRGHTTCLIAMRSRYFRLKDPNVHVDAIPLRHKPILSNAFFMLAVFLSLPIYMNVYKPNFVVITPDVTILGIIPHIFALKLRKIKLVLDVRSTPIETRGFSGTLRKHFFSISMLSAKKMLDGITIITPIMKKELCLQFRISDDQFGVWPVGVSTVLFDPKRFINEGKDLKEKLGLSNKFLVLYHGSFSPMRGLIEVIKAIKTLKSEHPNIVFFLLGSGSMVSVLREIILNEGLQNNVIIHDPVDQNEVPKFISACDVGIIPLPDNPFWRAQCPLKLIEYLAMEKVVLATDIPAHRLVIGKAKCGVYISSTKPESIAKTIDFVYHRKEKLAEWGRQGRALIQKRYTWEKVAKDLENYLFSIENQVR